MVEHYLGLEQTEAGITPPNELRQNSKITAHQYLAQTKNEDNAALVVQQLKGRQEEIDEKNRRTANQLRNLDIFGLFARFIAFFYG
jgi:hypothetical protein